MTAMTPLQTLHTAIQAGDDEAAEAAVLALSPADAPALISWLRAADADQRWWAARGLAHCGGDDVMAALLARLTDEDAAVRGAVAFSLGALHSRHPHAVRPLLPALAALLADPDGRVRQVAADALARCGDDALPALATILTGEEQGARTRAAYALHKIRSPQSTPLLFRYLNDPNYMVHTYVYEALDSLGLLENALLLP